MRLGKRTVTNKVTCAIQEILGLASVIKRVGPAVSVSQIGWCHGIELAGDKTRRRCDVATKSRFESGRSEQLFETFGSYILLRRDYSDCPSLVDDQGFHPQSQGGD